MKPTYTQIDQALKAFGEVTVKHQLQDATLDFLLFMLRHSPNTRIVNLVGPTGIGKSRLQRQIISCIQQDYEEAMKEDPDCVPIFRTEALASGHRLFDWKGLYRSALFELGDPFSSTRKALPGQPVVAAMQFARAGESRTASELRMYLADEFGKRKTKFWIIDEAQHIVFGGRSGQPGDQFDVIKSIAQTTGVKLLLAGPTEMEGGLGRSPQLARRSATVHFPRYLHGNAEHMQEFGSVVATLFSKMDVAGYPPVKPNLKFFYSASAGCVGIVKDWIAVAYGLALREETPDQRAIITMKHLELARLSTGTMESVMEDIFLEEENSRGTTTNDAYERIVTGDAQRAIQEPIKPAKKSKSNRRSGRVGLRSPGVRDKVPTGKQEPGAANV